MSCPAMPTGRTLVLINGAEVGLADLNAAHDLAYTFSTDAMTRRSIS